MSAQLVLTDREMDVILKCVRSVAGQTYPPPRLGPDELSAALTIAGKLTPHAERKSRRRR